MTNVVAGVLMWIVMFFPDQRLDLESIQTYPYETQEQCEASADVFLDMIKTNEELSKLAIEQGYEGVLVICTDDPNPFQQTKTDQ